MKKIFAMAIATVTVVACTTTKKAEPVKTKAQQLLERLDTLRQKGIMYGHQDDPFYGLTWEYDKDSSDVKNVCGDWPAVMGFELGGIEMGDEKNLDSVPFTRMREEILNHYNRGGIITISWHPRNPVTTIEGGGNAGQKFPEGTAWDVSDSTIVKNVLEGGSRYDLFQTWMQRVSDFLASLKTADGEKIPFIFRPWHENSGSWFWWGEKLCTAEEYKALWNLLQDKLIADGFDNLVWAYSPGCQDNLTADRLLDRYPGDDRVDMLGLDGYQWVPEEKEAFIERTKQNLSVLCEVLMYFITSTSECRDNSTICSYTVSRSFFFCSLALREVSAKNGPSMYVTMRGFFPNRRFRYVFTKQKTGALSCTGYAKDVSGNGLILVYHGQMWASG